MDDKIFDSIKYVDLKETMENSYIDYAMSVIASRALPDVRDGLKPVQRRVLLKVMINEEAESEIDLTFSTLMGDKVEPRREFIEEHAKFVKNLDV